MQRFTYTYMLSHSVMQCFTYIHTSIDSLVQSFTYIRSSIDSVMQCFTYLHTLITSVMQHMSSPKVRYVQSSVALIWVSELWAMSCELCTVTAQHAFDVRCLCIRNASGCAWHTWLSSMWGLCLTSHVDDSQGCHAKPDAFLIQRHVCAWRCIPCFMDHVFMFHGPANSLEWAIANDYGFNTA